MVCYNITAYNEIINFTVSKREVYNSKLRAGIKAERGMVMKGKNLERAVILGLLLSTGVIQTGICASSVDGNNKNGILTLDGGEYNEIIGKGSTVTLSGSKSPIINNNAKVSLSNLTATRILGGASWISPANGYNINAEAKNNIVEANNITVNEIYGGMATITDGSGSNYAIVENNRLYLNNSEVTKAIYGQQASIYPGNGNDLSAIANGGDFIIENSIINGEIYGTNANTMLASDVELSINGGITTIYNSNVKSDVYSAYAQSYVSSGFINIKNSKLIIDNKSEMHNIFGGTAYLIDSIGDTEVLIDNNSVEIIDGCVNGNVYIGYIIAENANFTGEIKNNKLFLKNYSDLSKANLYGYYATDGKNEVNIINDYNDLIVDGWKGKEVNSLNNFNNIKFQNIEWENEGVVVEVLNNNATSSLENTKIDLRDSTTLAGGKNLNVNDYMYFIKTDNGTLATKDENILVNQNSNGDNIFTAGVAFEGTGEVSVEDNGNVKYTIKDIKATDQTESVGEGASIAAAFLVTGGDLVVEGLNAMEQDQLFGTKTFAIVEGHKSTYDVADDLKINGWNGLYGVGNIKQLEDGNWSYAAFFENGIANYRTYNSFLGETFRGDGNVVYNGGGLAGRYKKDNGVYAEASLRAGLLKNDMENIFRDGNGNNYVYKTETPYYAFHAGIGKLFSVNESTDWDLYTRYYHTYNDGDNFSVAGDKFEVDSLTSDRLRIGTRYITNKNNQWSTYYGLAWEYEFDGDSDVKVNGTSLETETLEGSSYFAEIGFNYQKEKTSPWSFEGRLRGYAGVREGISGILRATYSF